MSLGGAEFYPQCVQLRVGGSKSGYPASNELVTFPGAYADRDPGLFVPGIFEPGFQYQIPGPPVAKLALQAAPASLPEPSSPSSTRKTSGSSVAAAPTKSFVAAPAKTTVSTSRRRCRPAALKNRGLVPDQERETVSTPENLGPRRLGVPAGYHKRSFGRYARHQ